MCIHVLGEKKNRKFNCYRIEVCYLVSISSNISSFTKRWTISIANFEILFYFTIPRVYLLDDTQCKCNTTLLQVNHSSTTINLANVRLSQGGRTCPITHTRAHTHTHTHKNVHRKAHDTTSLVESYQTNTQAEQTLLEINTREI